jgi:hypothetical protein
MIPVFWILLFNGCSEKTTLKDLAWLEGTWVAKAGMDTIVEKWASVTPELMHGFSLSVKNGDTIMNESIQLFQKGDTLIYEPTVYDQNLGEAISFPLEGTNGTTFRFTNPNHDFPQHITYTKCPGDRFVAEVYAMKNGKREGFMMLFERNR